MTPLRQAFHAGLLLAGLSLTGSASAQTSPAIGPPTAEELAASAPAVQPAPAAPALTAKAAPAKVPSWLAAHPSPKTPATGRSALPSSGRLIGLLLVLGSLGGATLYLKRRARGEHKRVAPPKRLSVLSSTRIGPKAHAVVIAVGGRQMLLGVTDSSVKRLAFIDELEEDESERDRERERELTTPARRPPAQAASRAVAMRASAPESAKPGAFADLLKTAFGKRSPAPQTDAASILAAETQDTVGGKAVAANPSNVRMLDVEGQAQGLIRRLSGPRA